MVVSKSGDSPEIKVLLPLLNAFGNKIIGMGGNTTSYLAQNCHIYINTTVAQEACPNNLAPTSSTTAQLVMGDALAVCLMELKGFNSSDFAKFHPGGALGKKLYLRVSDILSAYKPVVAPEASVRDVIIEITKNRLGATAVVSADEKILGIITDGDIRRMVERNNDFIGLQAKDIMSLDPKIIEQHALAAEAFEIMRTNHINQLLVTHNGSYVGIIHIQELIREGII
jgi:arabinose-5-phosphate isomerase